MVPELRKRIEAFQNEFFPKIPKEIIAPLLAGVEDLAQSGIERSALQVGGQAPDFELPNSAGQPVRLAHLLTHGPAVVTFYRGGW
jgi:hypothetical protein